MMQFDAEFSNYVAFLGARLSAGASAIVLHTLGMHPAKIKKTKKSRPNGKKEAHNLIRYTSKYYNGSVRRR